LQRVFAVDVLKCPMCDSRRRWVAVITEPDATHRILEHLGLQRAAPAPAPAYVDHYLAERAHQGLGNARIESAKCTCMGEVRCTEQLGGILKHDSRAA